LEIVFLEIWLRRGEKRKRCKVMRRALGRADTWERRETSRAYVFDGDSRSAHRTSAESTITVSGPSGTIGYTGGHLATYTISSMA
jgi:hypothetical protein